MKISRQQPVINTSAALVAAKAALAHGTTLGTAMVVAVVDSSGTLMALLRADGAFSASVEIARDKAYTAATFGVSTDQLCAALNQNEILREGIALRPNIILFGGGLPIKEEQQVIGAIGVSGGSEDEDRACAEAGVRALQRDPFSD